MIAEVVGLLPAEMTSAWAGMDFGRVGEAGWEHVDLLPDDRRLLIRYEAMGQGHHALRLDLSELISWELAERSRSGGVPVEGSARDEVLTALLSRSDTAVGRKSQMRFVVSSPIAFGVAIHWRE